MRKIRVKEYIEKANKNFEELSDNNPEKTLIELMCLNTALENEKILKTIKGVNYSNRALQIQFKKKLFKIWIKHMNISHTYL